MASMDILVRTWGSCLSFHSHATRFNRITAGLSFGENSASRFLDMVAGVWQTSQMELDDASRVDADHSSDHFNTALRHVRSPGEIQPKLHFPLACERSVPRYYRNRSDCPCIRRGLQTYVGRNHKLRGWGF